MTMEEIREQQLLLNAYYAGFNQVHYSHLHPEICEPENMIVAAKKWYEKEYRKKIHIHHSGNIVENEGDNILIKR